MPKQEPTARDVDLNRYYLVAYARAELRLMKARQEAQTRAGATAQPAADMLRPVPTL